MSVVVLSLAVAVSLGLLALVLNHCQARLALVELALNEGLPPGHEPVGFQTMVAPASAAVARSLDGGVHVFLSRSCFACQRLLEELAESDFVMQAPLSLYYIDKPRPLAGTTATRLGASLHESQDWLSVQVQADPLPYTIAVGDHDLVSRAVTPTVAQIIAAARDAGISTSVSEPA